MQPQSKKLVWVLNGFKSIWCERESGTNTKNMAVINRSVTSDTPCPFTARAPSSSHELVPNKGKCGGRRATCQWTKSSVAAFLWSMIIKHKTQPKEPTNIIAELFRTTCGKNCAACARSCSDKRQGLMDWRTSRPRFPVSNTGIMGCLHLLQKCYRNTTLTM